MEEEEIALKKQVDSSLNSLTFCSWPKFVNLVIWGHVIL